MRHLVLLVVFFLSFSIQSGASDLVKVRSAFSVKETADRFESILKAKKFTIFNRIDHSKGAQGVGLDLRPTELILFGNPKVGTQLMLARQTTAIDLPMKALVYQDKKGQVWLAYNSADYLAGRHGIRGKDAVLSKIKKALAGLSAKATNR